MIKPDELGAEGQWVRLTVLAVALVLMTAGCGGSEPASVKPVSAPTYVVPDPGTVKDYDGYWRQACGPAIPADRVDLAAPRAVTGDAAEQGFVRTVLLDAGRLDVRDGRLHATGGESAPYPVEESPLQVPKGTHPAVVIAAETAEGSLAAAAVVVRVAPGEPVRWTEERSLGAGTDAGIVWLGGIAARERLAEVRDAEQAMAEIDETEFWLTPCESFGTDKGGSAGLQIATGGDGGFPGARGVDDEGRTVAVMMSTALLPWSQLGIPGEPPPEATEG